METSEPAVSAVPPRLRVLVSEISSETYMARSISSAAASLPKCSSIMAAVQTAATGLATPLPATSGAEPCTGSNIDGYVPSGLILVEGTMPMEPATAGPRTERISPNRLDATTTSTQPGCSTKCAVMMSIWNYAVSIPGYRSAASANRSSQKSIVWMIPLGFVAETTCLRLRAGVLVHNVEVDIDQHVAIGQVI